MKRGEWEKKRFIGVELRGKTLGVIGLGRIGQEVAARARAFGMEIVAHDPFIAARAAGSSGRSRCGSTSSPPAPTTSRCTCRPCRDPQPDQCRAARGCKKGVRIVNTARGELIDEAALADAIERGPRRRRRARRVRDRAADGQAVRPLPQVVATPHIAASTNEAQELVGIEIAINVRDLPLDGVIRNAVNFPAVPRDDVPAAAVFAARGKDRRASRPARRASPQGARHPLLRAARMTAYETGRQRRAGRRAEASATEDTVRELPRRSRRARPGSRRVAELTSARLHPRHLGQAAHRDRERWVEGMVVEPGSPRLTLD